MTTEYQRGVEDAIDMLESLKTRTELLGGQSFKYIQLGEAISACQVLWENASASKLKPWDEEDTTPPLEYELTVEDDRVDFVAENGMSVWIEWQEGRVQVHCFRPGRDEPVNIKIKEDEIEIDNFDYQMTSN